MAAFMQLTVPTVKGSNIKCFYYLQVYAHFSGLKTHKFMAASLEIRLCRPVVISDRESTAHMIPMGLPCDPNNAEIDMLTSPPPEFMN